MTLDAATEQRARAALLDCQRRVLERTASGARSRKSLKTLVKLIEEQIGDMRLRRAAGGFCSGRSCASRQRRTFRGYKAGIEPFLLIAPNMGSCGTAAVPARAHVYARHR